jgi:glycosyltransferase involved in cell wall biosynthesis
MASGLPVIVSDRAGSSDIVRDGIDGFVIPSGNAQMLKEKIIYFYNNRDKIEEMGKNASLNVRNYTWEKYRENVRNAIYKILGG